MQPEPAVVLPWHPRERRKLSAADWERFEGYVEVVIDDISAPSGLGQGNVPRKLAYVLGGHISSLLRGRGELRVVKVLPDVEVLAPICEHHRCGQRVSESAARELSGKPSGGFTHVRRKPGYILSAIPACATITSRRPNHSTHVSTAR